MDVHRLRPTSRAQSESRREEPLAHLQGVVRLYGDAFHHGSSYTRGRSRGRARPA